MTAIPEKRDEWREVMNKALKQAHHDQRAQEAEFFAAILALLDHQAISLPLEQSYADAINAIQTGIATGEQRKEKQVIVSCEMLQAMRDFVNAENWDTTRQVVRAQQAILFSLEVEALFEQNLSPARSAENQRAVRLLEQHLALLRECKMLGIEQAFARLEAA